MAHSSIKPHLMYFSSNTLISVCFLLCAHTKSGIYDLEIFLKVTCKLLAANLLSGHPLTSPWPLPYSPCPLPPSFLCLPSRGSAHVHYFGPSAGKGTKNSSRCAGKGTRQAF